MKEKLDTNTYGEFVERENYIYGNFLEDLWKDPEQFDNYPPAHFTVLLPSDSTVAWNRKFNGFPKNDHCLLQPVGVMHESGVQLPCEVTLGGKEFRTLTWFYLWDDEFSPEKNPEQVALSQTELPKGALALTWSRCLRSTNSSSRKVPKAYTTSWPYPIVVQTFVGTKSRKLKRLIGEPDFESERDVAVLESKTDETVAALQPVISPQLQ